MIPVMQMSCVVGISEDCDFWEMSGPIEPDAADGMLHKAVRFTYPCGEESVESKLNKYVTFKRGQLESGS